MNWISHKERKPEEYTEVLVLLDNGEIFKAVYCDDHEYSWTSEYFQLNLDSEITHWMPLPKPPGEI